MTRYGLRKLQELSKYPNDLPWDDIRFSANSIGLKAATAPDVVVFRGSRVIEFIDSPGSELVYFEVQMPHRWAEGTDIEFHIHWSIDTNGSGAGVENVKWTFTYSWANIDDSFPAETTASVTVDVQNDAQYDHLLTPIIEHIDANNKLISSILCCSLTRDTTVANDYNGHALLISGDFHYQSDSDGSYHEYEKLKGKYIKRKGTSKNKFKSGAW